MIVPVDKHNEQQWAALCASLWPESPPAVFLAERQAGELADEYLYLAEGDAAAETTYVAFLSLSLRRDYVEGASSSPVGYIEGIYVEPGWRGRGIARELVDFAKAWSRERGCRELASDCELPNTDSRAFHGRVGFAEAGTIVCFTMALDTPEL